MVEFLLVLSPSASSSTTDIKDESDILSSDLPFLIISKYSVNLYILLLNYFLYHFCLKFLIKN